MSALDKMKVMMGRAIVRLITDSTKLQELQIETLADEARGKAERFQQYGFSSHPKPGAEAIVLYLGGDRSHPVVIAVDDRRYRLKNMLEGEVAIYTDEGDCVHIKRNGNIKIKASTQVSIECPSVNMDGNLNVEGNITCDNNISDENGSMNEMRTVYNGHTNLSNGTAPPTQQMT